MIEELLQAGIEVVLTTVLTASGGFSRELDRKRTSSMISTFKLLFLKSLIMEIFRSLLLLHSRIFMLNFALK